MNLKSRKTVFITGLCLASLVSGVPLPANASADTTAMIQQQSVKIKGRVTDASGEPVIGANVVYEEEIHPSDELDGGRFWKIEEIKENLGKGIFTPNFEEELKKVSLIPSLSK